MFKKCWVAWKCREGKTFETLSVTLSLYTLKFFCFLFYPGMWTNLTKDKVTGEKKIQILLNVSIFYVYRDLQKRNAKPKEMVRPGGLYIILTKGCKVWYGDQEINGEWGVFCLYAYCL